jgi:hypothetical protein
MIAEFAGDTDAKPEIALATRPETVNGCDCVGAGESESESSIRYARSWPALAAATDVQHFDRVTAAQ